MNDDQVDNWKIGAVIVGAIMLFLVAVIWMGGQEEPELRPGHEEKSR